jgi:hypothetical protein
MQSFPRCGWECPTNTRRIVTSELDRARRKETIVESRPGVARGEQRIVGSAHGVTGSEQRIAGHADGVAGNGQGIVAMQSEREATPRACLGVRLLKLAMPCV